ncbi:MobC family plasmid mobilization relaxosome protein [Sulfurimonas sp. HSL-3221]|uniref:plasmid mobilization protein n=1 Tax=Sulfurimonadaceae TaxID=2771471 RepID=UPI001E5BCC07|nr:plasmid mobilization relaxosome protein MobC [Sulfurimonas sp. HSL-3221]UFS61820.1 MobC family plasmid mobilization relaxosome protein [Sulfurimonas sp. HSL-3221]
MGKSKRITIRLSEKEHDELIRKAAEAEMRISALIRAAIDSAQIDPCDKKNVPLPLLRELNAIGNNLNQIARHLNFGNPVDIAVLSGLAEIEDDLVALSGQYAD